MICEKSVISWNVLICIIYIELDSTKSNIFLREPAYVLFTNFEPTLQTIQWTCGVCEYEVVQSIYGVFHDLPDKLCLQILCQSEHFFNENVDIVIDGNKSFCANLVSIIRINNDLIPHILLKKRSNFDVFFQIDTENILKKFCVFKIKL